MIYMPLIFYMLNPGMVADGAVAVTSLSHECCLTHAHHTTLYAICTKTDTQNITIFWFSDTIDTMWSGQCHFINILQNMQSYRDMRGEIVAHSSGVFCIYACKMIIIYIRPLNGRKVDYAAGVFDVLFQP